MFNSTEKELTEGESSLVPSLMSLSRRACALHDINCEQLDEEGFDETASINSDISDQGGGVASVSINSDSSGEGGVSINSNATDEGGLSVSKTSRPARPHVTLSDQHNPLLEQHSIHHGIKSLLSIIVSYL